MHRTHSQYIYICPLFFSSVSSLFIFHTLQSPTQFKALNITIEELIESNGLSIDIINRIGIDLPFHKELLMDSSRVINNLVFIP